MSLWRRTVWGRLPSAYARPAVHRSLAALVALTALPPAYLLWRGNRGVPPLADFAFRTWLTFPDSQAVWEAMSAQQRADIQVRIQDLVERLLPSLLLTSIALALAGALVCLWLGRFLHRHWDRAEDDRPRAGAPTRPPMWSAWLAAAAGFVAHLPFLLRGFSADEGWAALHLQSGLLAWASTWDGWEVHMGGELLGRLAGAVFGSHEFALRLPSAVLSAAGLGITHRWVEERHDALTAWLTTGLLCALPLWAEQTTLLRGYGLMFFAAAWNLSVLWRILDGPAHGTESRRLAAFSVSLFLGFFAHVFFVFYAIAVLSLLAWRARADRNASAMAALIWGAVALLPPAILDLPGLPMVFYETGMNQLTPVSSFLADAGSEMVEELGFRLVGGAAIAASVLVACWLWGVWKLDRTARARLLTIAGISIGVPLLLRPAAFPARFFIFLLPLVFPAALPVVGLLGRIPMPSVRTATAAILLIVLWALPTWRNGPTDVDMRELCAAIVHVSRPGDRVVIDRYLTSARVCLPEGLNARYVKAALSMAPAADIVTAKLDDGPVPPGFVEAARIPGKWWSVIVYKRADKQGAPW